MKTGTLLITILLLSGCASIDKTMSGGTNSMPDEGQRKELVLKFPELTQTQKTQFLSGNAWIGMTQAQLNALWGGEPAKKQNKLTASGAEETQIYSVRVGNWKTGITTKYFKVKMMGGKMSEMQELDGNVGSLDNL